MHPLCGLIGTLGLLSNTYLHRLHTLNVFKRIKQNMILYKKKLEEKPKHLSLKDKQNVRKQQTGS